MVIEPASRVVAQRLGAGDAREIPTFVPSLRLSTDNAAMIAAAGLRKLRAGITSPLDINADAALARFRDHLAPGGVILVEPWFPPGVLDTERVAENTGEADGVRVVRRSRVEVEGRLSRLFFDYEISGAAETRRVSEVHELGLFTTAELLDAFRRAGLAVRHDPKGLTDRGLFIGYPELR